MQVPTMMMMMMMMSSISSHLTHPKTLINNIKINPTTPSDITKIKQRIHHHHYHHHHQNQIKINRRKLMLFLSLPLSTFTVSPNSNLFTSYAAAAAVEGGDEEEDSMVFNPVTEPERDASAELSRRIAEAVRLLDQGRELQAKGDFARALDYFTLVIKDYKDFAFTDYARVGRALVLYEIGDRDESIAEMEDVSISLKGYPEVHAALAAALYVDKHAPLLAENQFTIATLLDPHYTDLSYVKDTKHWPPSLVSSLQHFITLS